MQTKMEIADAFCKSVDIIVDRKLEKLAFNSTIVGRVAGPPNNNVYQIEYQDKIFTARPLDVSQEYSENDYVYILVPNNAENRTRYIMGTVQLQAAPAAYSRSIDLEEKIAQLETDLINLRLEVEKLGGNRE